MITRRTTIAAVALGLTVLGAQGALAADHEFKLHQFLGANAPAQTKMLQPWADAVAEASGGKVHIEIFPSMTLGGRPPELISQVRDIRRMGTASLDLCMVASGRVNAYFERCLKPWDHAAGALIAQESGATVKGRGDNAAGEDFILAAEPTVARLLEDVLARLDV